MRTLKALAALYLATTASAWSKDVHQQIGYSAAELMQPETLDFLSHILEPIYNGSLGLAASWADDYAHTAEGAFSYQWHWIDTHDYPPSTCTLDYNHDCSKGGCVVGEIANQTNILKDCISRLKAGEAVNDRDLQCSYALKWVIHFLGDITQPLHASGRAAGGNKIHVTYGGIETNLHSVWDGLVIHDYAGVAHFPNHTIHPFFAKLVQRIRDGNFAIPPSEWLFCCDPFRALDCATTWARESNGYSCASVYSYDLTNDLKFNGYFDRIKFVIELRVSVAALRLATWLERLVREDGSAMLLPMDSHSDNGHWRHDLV